MTHQAQAAYAKLKSINPNFKPQLALVLSSGLDSFIEEIENPIQLSYAEIPGFPHLTVQGHSGKLIMGRLAGVDLICLQGRAHYYEGMDSDAVKTYVRVLRLMGCQYFIATNVSGSLREEVGPGELVLINDHINFQGQNPLIGPNDDELGPRFFPLDNAYDKGLRERFLSLAKEEELSLHQGVYISVLGPNYETAAEIKAFRLLGADVIGMSTVPEVLVANHCGMKVAVLAIITNFATGIAATSHSHEEVIKAAAEASSRLNYLLTNFIKSLAKRPI